MRFAAVAARNTLVTVWLLSVGCEPAPAGKGVVQSDGSAGSSNVKEHAVRSSQRRSSPEPKWIPPKYFGAIRLQGDVVGPFRGHDGQGVVLRTERGTVVLLQTSDKQRGRLSLYAAPTFDPGTLVQDRLPLPSGQMADVFIAVDAAKWRADQRAYATDVQEARAKHEETVRKWRASKAAAPGDAR